MITASIDILLVESNAAEADHLESLLGSLPGLNLNVCRVADSGAAHEHLEHHRPSLLMLRLETARAKSKKLLREFRNRHSWLPVLLVAADHDPEAAETLVREGAQECLGQDELLPDLLIRSIRHALARHAAEAALRANEDLMRLVAENTTDLIAVLDRDGRRLFNSPSYARTFGDAVDLFGTDSFAEIHPEDREAVRQLFRNTLRTGKGHQAEFRFQLPGGTVRWMESVGSVIRDPQGNPDRVVVVSRDLTEKHKLMEGLDHTVSQLRKIQAELAETRQRLRDTEKSEACLSFALATAPELRSNAQTVLPGLDLLKTLLPEDDEATNDVLRDMTEATRRTDHILAAWLEVAGRKAPSETAPQNINQLIQYCMEAVASDAQAKDLRLEYKPVPRAQKFFGDPVQLRRVLLSLLLDCIHSTPEKGRVSVMTRIRRAGLAGALENPTEHSAVLIEIADERPPTHPQSTSSGSSPDEATLRHVVERLGGSAEATWNDAGGLRISILLPSTPERPSDAPTETTE